MALCASSDLIGVAQLADHARRRINGAAARMPPVRVPLPLSCPS